MHEQARLTKSHQTLGQVGQLVSIEDIEKNYSTSAKANSAVEVECANTRCKVKVRITIISPSKPGRKITPSSYFHGKHIAGCDRKPSQPQLAPMHASPTQGANPDKNNIPAVWVDPIDTSPGSGGPTAISPSQINPSGASTQGRSRTGAGTSKSQSQRVERFAKEWLKLTQQVRKTQPLEAPWNLGGTYASAFYPFDYQDTESMYSVGTRIHTASVVSGKLSNGDFYIRLKEQKAHATPKIVIINAAMLSASVAGQSLAMQLINPGVPTSKTYIFFLGAFLANQTTSQEELIVAHPHYFYVQT